MAVQGTPSNGNVSLLVMADSAAREERLVLDRTLLAALDHFGMPFQILDLAADTLTTEVLLSHSALVLAQSGLGRIADQKYPLRRPVAFTALERIPRGDILAQTEQDRPAVFPSRNIRVPTSAASRVCCQ